MGFKGNFFYIESHAEERVILRIEWDFFSHTVKTWWDIWKSSQTYQIRREQYSPIRSRLRTPPSHNWMQRWRLFKHCWKMLINLSRKVGDNKLNATRVLLVTESPNLTKSSSENLSWTGDDASVRIVSTLVWNFRLHNLNYVLSYQPCGYVIITTWCEHFI